MCVGDRVNTENSVFPRESHACSSLLKPRNSGKLSKAQRGSQEQFHTVPQVCACSGWADVDGGYW